MGSSGAADGAFGSGFSAGAGGTSDVCAKVAGARPIERTALSIIENAVHLTARFKADWPERGAEFTMPTSLSF